MPSWLLLNLLRRWTQSVIKLHTRLLLLFPLFCSSSNRRHQRLIHCTSKGEIKDNMAGSPQKTVYTSTPLWASHGAGLDECLRSEYDRPPRGFCCPPLCKETESREPTPSRSGAEALRQESARPRTLMGSEKVAGVNSVLTSSMAGVCVHDQEAPTCSNGRCGEGDRRGTKGMHNTGTKPRKRGHCGSRVWQKSQKKTYNGRRAACHSLLLFPEIIWPLIALIF